jgi:hypothetical protein
MTTFIDVFILDECLFNAGIEAAIIADTRGHAEDIFRRKIDTPFQNLPEQLGQIIEPEEGTKGSTWQLRLNNGSVISVSTSMRSGTVQLLHISEFGKIAAKYPDKADEIVTGSLQAAKSQKALIFIESTAEGHSGHFYDYCQTAIKTAKEIQAGTYELNIMDYKFHFYAWWEEPSYVLDIPLRMSDEDNKYFDDLEVKVQEEMGVTVRLTNAQKAWYLSKRKTMRRDDLMKREFPGVPSEAFDVSIEGAYFSSQMIIVRKDGRICNVPAKPGILVNTWWDLGMDDTTCILFTQDVGREIHHIDYHEESGEGLPHYYDVMKAKGYRYGKHFAPHDISVRELGTGKSRIEQARSIGLAFRIVPKVGDKMDSIEAARSIFKLCWFDRIKCEKLIEHLDSYRKEWDDKRSCYRSSPLHDKHSNGADGFQTFAMGHNFGFGGFGSGEGYNDAGPRKVVTSKKWGGA